MTEELGYKVGATRKIHSQLGRWYILMLNIKYQRWFNGLPPQDSIIHILDDNVRKNAEAQVDGYEMVFEVIHAPDHDLIPAEGENRWEKVSPVAKVGDIVLCKGNVFKLHCEPVCYAAVRDNMVAVVKLAEDRPEYGGAELEWEKQKVQPEQSLIVTP